MYHIIAYNDGIKAYNEDRSMSDCPYQLRSPEAAAWLAGYLKANGNKTNDDHMITYHKDHYSDKHEDHNQGVEVP